MFGMSVDGKFLQKTYKIEEKLGAGGNGQIYKAWHIRLRKHYAIKVHRAGSMGPLSVQRNEAEALNIIKSSYVPQVFDFLTDENTNFTVMEYIEGESFDKLLGHKRKYGESEVTKWHYQLAVALEEIHEKGICHRDIKPSNIMLTKNGDICLIDFDAAIIKGKSIGIINQSLGYASPEQIGFFNLCKKADAKHVSKVAEPRLPYPGIDWKLSDIYSLGTTMHHLLTGKHPYEKESISGNFIRKIKNTTELEKIIEKSMHPTPKERFTSAQELKSAILELLLTVNR